MYIRKYFLNSYFGIWNLGLFPKGFFLNPGVKECMHIPAFQESLIFLFLVPWFFFGFFTGWLSYPLSEGFAGWLPKVYPCVFYVNHTSVWTQDLLLSVPSWSGHASACSVATMQRKVSVIECFHASSHFIGHTVEHMQ